MCCSMLYLYVNSMFDLISDFGNGRKGRKNPLGIVCAFSPPTTTFSWFAWNSGMLHLAILSAHAMDVEIVNCEFGP